jgi:hypothetical protein
MPCEVKEYQDMQGNAFVTPQLALLAEIEPIIIANQGSLPLFHNNSFNSGLGVRSGDWALTPYSRTPSSPGLRHMHLPAALRTGDRTIVKAPSIK